MLQQELKISLYIRNIKACQTIQEFPNPPYILPTTTIFLANIKHYCGTIPSSKLPNHRKRPENGHKNNRTLALQRGYMQINEWQLDISSTSNIRKNADEYYWNYLESMYENTNIV